MVYILVAEGFEEIEVIAPTNILRRAKIDVTTVGIGSKTVLGSHSIPLVTDITDAEFDFSDALMLVLPGGNTGVENLNKSTVVHDAIDYCMQKGLFIAAICAAPVILAKKGLLKGKTVTAYPSVIKELEGAIICDEPVVRDGNVITGKSAGTAPEFAFELIKVLSTLEEADQVRSDLG